MTTLADGSVTMSIVANSAFRTNLPVWANADYLPFVSMSSTNSTLPFITEPQFNQPGPFFGQRGNTVNFAIDALMIDFVETESPLTVKGKLENSWFY